ncbi:hypothetical protein HPB50_000155 [Hyalomma asiaticum]|uniref:Uncharacterized protein n=1 Tax=Hyalomma asiaticum TaxID=266040 RepID=A0ACB7TA53_HYAAI|nr:hypothetical protein HPB50_000155 [Hyalomma asiaticum]
MAAPLSACPHVTTVGDFTKEDIARKQEQWRCESCGASGPSLWACLYRDCLYVGCGEAFKDHSTQHFQGCCEHSVTLNLSTLRVWCYLCESEVFLENNRPPLLGASPRISNQPAGYARRAAAATACATADSDDEADRENSLKPRGLTGLQNLGNTCYMNAALQALSNWPSYVVPSGIAYGIKMVYPVFRGYSQQDAQEFLRCFLDQLHEELKAPVGAFARLPLGRPRSPTTESSESSLSEDEEDFETCDSGLSSEKSSCGDDQDLLLRTHGGQKEGIRLRATVEEKAAGDWTPLDSTSSGGSKGHRARKLAAAQRLCSIVSDVFDGRILSSVQCLTCDTVSTTRETFQDLSLPIPSRDHLAVLHAAQGSGNTGVPGAHLRGALEPQQGWLSWILGRMFSWVFGQVWLWGPGVALQDCLAAFFSADELKGDNMYSCDKCCKLRNGIKYSRVLQLPEVLCIHLKRFRHEVMFSSKISSYVSFPLEGLDMAPFLHSG